MTSAGWRDHPVIERDAIRLRSFRDSDWPGIVEAAADRYIVATTTVPAECDEHGARQFVARQQRRLAEGTGHSFAIARRSDDAFVGQIGVWLRDLPQGRAELGYWVVPSARGTGVATSALAAASEFAYTLDGLIRLELYIEPDNAASIRTAERSGYLREGLLRSHQVIAGSRRDMFIYSRIRSPAHSPYTSESDLRKCTGIYTGRSSSADDVGKPTGQETPVPPRPQ